MVIDKAKKIKKKILRKFEGVNFKITFERLARQLDIVLKLKPKSEMGEDWSPRVQLSDKIGGPLLTEERPL